MKNNQTFHHLTGRIYVNQNGFEFEQVAYGNKNELSKHKNMMIVAGVLAYVVPENRFSSKANTHVLVVDLKDRSRAKKYIKTWEKANMNKSTPFLG